MATYTSNYNLEKPEATDPFGDFRQSYNANMDIIDANLGGGGGSGGHTILDGDGNALPQEDDLQFTGACSVSDDNVNGRTVVNVEACVEVTQAEYDALPASKLTDDIAYFIVDGESDEYKAKADKTDLASIQITGSTNNTGSTISSGTYFYLNDTLVRAKTDISNGATLTLNTNYEVITAGALNELQTAISEKGLSENLLTANTTGLKNLGAGKNLSDYSIILISLESGYILYDTSFIPYNLFKSGFSILARVDASNYARITYSTDTSITVNQLAGSYSLRVIGVK